MASSTHRALPLLAFLGTLAVLALAVVIMIEEPGPRPIAPAPGPVDVSQPQTDSGLPAPVSGRAPRRPAPAPREEMAVEAPAPGGPQHIAVRVFDVANGEPVAAFQVTVLPAGDGPPRLRLDQALPQPFHLAKGIAALPQAPGTYDVVVQAPGFLPGELSGVVVPALNGRPHDMPLSRGAGIAGRVLGPDNLSRAGVEVFLEVVRLADPADKPPLITLATSGADGGFSFSPLPDGEYAVTALELDNDVDRVAGIRVYGKATAVQLALAPRHQLSLKLEDHRGRPVDGALVELTGGGSMRSARSNPAGLVVIENLRDGHYTVRARSPGHQELSEELDLVGGSGQHLQWLRLSPAPDDG